MAAEWPTTRNGGRRPISKRCWPILHVRSTCRRRRTWRIPSIRCFTPSRLFTEPKRLARYWIVVASADHIRTAVDGHFVQAGHGRRAPVETFHHGDWVACYAPRERMSAGATVQAFKAVGAVVGDQVLAVDRESTDEHTSELQSLMRISYAVFCLKKKKKTNHNL